MVGQRSFSEVLLEAFAKKSGISGTFFLSDKKNQQCPVQQSGSESDSSRVHEGRVNRKGGSAVYGRRRLAWQMVLVDPPIPGRLTDVSVHA